jgi:drug/metabolite transporter (DMT)-like permease
MSYGLTAAAAWGISTIAAANAARRIGTYGALLVSQVLGLAVLAVLAAVLHPPLGRIGGGTIAGLAAAGLLGLLGWACYYRALESGPVGLVSAIGATYGGVTALLAVAVLGERIGSVGGAGVVLAVTGVAMAAARAPAARPAAVAAGGGAAVLAGRPGPGPVAGSGPRAGPGIPLALVSALTYGVGAFLLGRFAARAGWLTATLVAYAASVLALLLALPLSGKHLALKRSAGGLAWGAVAGLTEVTALLAFSRGGQVGQVAVTAAVSSLYPALALAGGILLFRERLSGRQLLGVGCIAAGVVLLGLA